MHIGHFELAVATTYNHWHIMVIQWLYNLYYVSYLYVGLRQQPKFQANGKTSCNCIGQCASENVPYNISSPFVFDSAVH